MEVNVAGGEVAAIFLVLMRVTGFVIAAPVFGNRAVPGQVKAGLAVALTIALLPHAQVAPAALPIALAAPLELTLGLVLGFILGLGVRAIEVAAGLLALQMGLSVSQVLNPLSGEHEDALGPLFTILAVTLFLVAGLHLALIGALASSMAAFPLGGGLPPTLGEIGVSAITLAIELGVRVALPLAVVLLLTELAVGLLARAITTINVFLLGLPLKIMVGLIGLLLAIPYIGRGAMEAFTAIFQLATGASVR